MLTLLQLWIRHFQARRTESEATVVYRPGLKVYLWFSWWFYVFLFFFLSLANSSTSILSQVLLDRYLIMDLPNSRMRPDWAATDWCRTLQSRYRRTYRENCSMMKDVYWLLTHRTSLPIIDTADEAMQTGWFSHGFDLERAFIAAPPVRCKQSFQVNRAYNWQLSPCRILF